MCVWIAAFVPQYFHLCYCDTLKKFQPSSPTVNGHKLSFFLLPVSHLSLYLGLPEVLLGLLTHLQLSSEIFFLCQFLLQVYSCLSPWVVVCFFFSPCQFLISSSCFPWKSSENPQPGQNCCGVYVDRFSSPSNWQKAGRGGARDKGMLSVGGVAHLPLESWGSLC